METDNSNCLKCSFTLCKLIQESPAVVLRNVNPQVLCSFCPHKHRKALKRFVLNKLNGDTVKWRRYRRSLLKHTAAMQKLKYQFLNINNNNKKRLKVQIKIKTNFIEEIKYNRDYREYSRSFLALLFILYKRLFQSIVATKLQVSCKDGCWQAAIP